MPIRKYRSVEEMEGGVWREPGTPELFEAIRSTWELARRTLRPAFPPGLYRHRSLVEAQELKAEWDRANFEAYHRRLGERSEVESSEKPLERGCAANPGYRMAPDFDEPLGDFEEHS